jgi:hypothetical protein
MSRAMARCKRVQARLGGARQALVGRLERGQQRLGAAGELGLLLRQAQRGLDVDHQVFIARARQALHQFFELGALQADLADAGFLDGQPRREFARGFLGLARQGARFDGLRAGINAAARQFFLDVAELLPQQAAGQQAAGRQRGHPQRPLAGHQPDVGRRDRRFGHDQRALQHRLVVGRGGNGLGCVGIAHG